jgi:sugar/nucleoside kinase (ribokinase family)
MMAMTASDASAGDGMRILVVGSVALDTIRTPDAIHRDLLGGSAAYAALAAIQFAAVDLVAVVGDDFPRACHELLAQRGIDLTALARVAGRTFRWDGEYDAELKERRTLSTEVGVFADFHPRLEPRHRDCDALLLGNIDPQLQLDVLRQVAQAPLTAVDTMNFWITGKPQPLADVLRFAHVLLINDEEARLLTGQSDIVRAAMTIHARGPAVVVVKKGPHGVAALGPWGWIALPAVPISGVQDPTGAGDAFAGGLIGYLAGRDWRRRDIFATALAVATSMASLAVEAFGVTGLARARREDMLTRCAQLHALTHFDLPQLA